MRDQGRFFDFLEVIKRAESGEVMKEADYDKKLGKKTLALMKQFEIRYDPNLVTNIPFWIWPRLAVAIVRVRPDGIDNRTIGRDMVTPFFTRPRRQCPISKLGIDQFGG